MRIKYNEDLDNIKKMAKDLMDYVIISYEKIGQFIENSKEDELKDLVDIHDDIRRKANEIERLSFELMALQQPVAKDLKLLQMSMKLASSFKRIAGHFEQVSFILGEYALNESEKDFLNKFIENETKMAKDAINSFVNYDKDLAKKTIKEDEINNKLFEKAISYISNENKKDNIGPMELSEKVLLYKYFERLGDRLARVADLSTRL